MEMTIHERLKKARKYLNLSQEYVASQLGLNRTAITDIESGKRNVTSEELRKFSELYSITLDQLIYGDDQNADVKILTRLYSELSENDKKEILNLIEFKRNLRNESLQR